MTDAPDGALREVWDPPDVDQSAEPLAVISGTTDWGTSSELYRDSYRAMLRVAYSITGNHAAAEDAVHDAFCAVGQRLDRLDDPAPYLRVAVVNRCRSMYRSNQRAAVHLARERPDVATDDAPDRGLAEFADALSHLSFSQRTAIVLRYESDLSDDAIATVLGCRQATVRSHIRRGLEQLRKELS